MQIESDGREFGSRIATLEGPGEIASFADLLGPGIITQREHDGMVQRILGRFFTSAHIILLKTDDDR